MPATHRSLVPRPALTLIELLVVITILSILLTLVAIYVVPAFQDNKNVVRGVDRVSLYVLIAKQRALRDQGARGIRFIVDPATNYCSQLQFIEQPDPFTGGTVTAVAATTAATFTGVDFFGAAGAGNTAQYNVQPGDYLRDLSSTSNYPILSVDTATSMTLRSPVVAAMTNSSQYQIVRQTRPITGEPLIDLPQNVVVDVGWMSTNSSGNQIPTGQFPSLNFYEILFDSGGGVTNRGSSTAIVLMVRDSTADNSLEPSTTYFITINPRTGMIATNPVGPSGTPLQYALDGRSSGM
jgi:prepilin-type N-terminal cleavage/methylation domain-containing protein